MYTLPPDAIAGMIYFSNYVSTSADIVVSFDYACYGPSASGSEGFCVFFSDTFAPTVQGGGAGPGLCYSSVSGVDTPSSGSVGGINSGIIGIGFDITGNFGSSNYFNTGYTDTVANSIAVRANHEAEYNIVTRTPNLNDESFGKPFNLYQQISNNQAPDYKRIRVRLTDFGNRVIVDAKNYGDLYFTNYLDYNISDYNASLTHSKNLSAIPVEWPVTVRCGLGFTSGQITNTTFKIKGFNINGAISPGIATGLYTYDIDTATLSATLAYNSPTNTLAEYDVLSARNVGIYGPLNQKVRDQTVLLDPANPLVIVSPSAGPLGVPYVAGNKYFEITPHA
jgi:hypothetical protein